MTNTQKNQHGGKREGAGRKPTGKPRKKQISTKVDQETRDKLKALSDESGHSQASILEWAIKSIKKLPKQLKI